MIRRIMRHRLYPIAIIAIILGAVEFYSGFYAFVGGLSAVVVALSFADRIVGGR